MLLIGLTGSIATGKSTVSTLLSSPPHSLPIIDADVLARQVVEPGTRGYRAIVAHFGDGVLEPADPPTMPERGPDGKGRPLDRRELGRRVFGDEPDKRARRRALNAIVHPAVRRAMAAAAARHYLAGAAAVVLDVPLLFEGGLDRFCGAALVVAVRDPAVQMARLRRRDPHLTEAEAAGRVGAQADVRLKARRCELRGRGRGAVVWNDGSREELAAEVERALAEIRASSPAWWGWLCLACPPLALAAGVWTFCQNVRINREWSRVEEQEKAKL